METLAMTETDTSPITDPAATRPPAFSLLEKLKPRPIPTHKPLGVDWQRKWLELQITHPDVRKLAGTAATFGARWFNRLHGKRWCVVSGDVGTGKSHVSRRVCRWARLVAFDAWRLSWHVVTGEALPTVVGFNWLEYASPERCDGSQWLDFLGTVEESSWAFIDDIGTETDQYRTGVPAQRLCELLNVCEGKFLWMTTNLPASLWEEKWDKRVEDRLLTAEIVEVNAPSYRSERP